MLVTFLAQRQYSMHGCISNQAIPGYLGRIAVLGRHTQMPIQELRNRRVAHQPVGELHNTMALVAETQVFHHTAARVDRRHDLLGLANWYARVVCAMDHHQRRADAIDFVNWRDRFEQAAIVL